jgi:DNA-binding NarL/FixJ family response regulator
LSKSPIFSVIGMRSELPDRKTVLLVDDHSLFRGGLKLLLARNPEYEVVGEAATIEQACHLVDNAAPEIILMDIAMPDHNGIEGTRRILRHAPAAKVIMISMYAKIDYVVQSLRAGAVGYIVKDSTPDILLDALASVAKGHYYFDPTILNEIVPVLLDLHIRTPAISDERYGELTPREQEVMRLVVKGLSSKAVAAELFISPKTVENHRTKVMEKLGLSTVIDLVKYAVKLGIVDVQSWTGTSPCKT